jgi:hypothetical protein
MKYKFKVGDKVKIIHIGSGCNIGTTGKIVTITELGEYAGKPGYKIDNILLDTNTQTGKFNGFIGESSFELVESTTSKFKIGDIVKLKHFPSKPIGRWNSSFLDYFKNVENKFTVLNTGTYNFTGKQDLCIVVNVKDYNGWNPEEAFELYQES